MSGQGIQDMYELSALQHGMLFHAMLEPEANLYLEQVVIPFSGALEPRAFEAAWHDVISGNDVLRTSFHWQEIQKPLQVVHSAARARVAHVDLRHLAAQAQHAELERFLTADRATGIRLDIAPLLRVALLRLSLTDFRLVLTFHHIILDGWSLQLLFRQFSLAYQARAAGRQPAVPPTRRYRDYIVWLQNQDLASAEAFWRHTLAGYQGAEPTLSQSRPDGRTAQYGEVEFALPEAVSAALSAASAKHRLTVNTLTQGAWAIVLSELTGADDLVFGVTVSGRPVDLERADTMLGLFINTIPLRVRISIQQRLGTWLRAIQDQQVEARQYEFTPLVQIQQWSDVPHGASLFNTILGFENYPVQAEARRGDGAQVTFAERTNYPLTVVVVPGHPVRVRLLHDRRQLDTATVELIGQRFAQLLEAIPADLSRRLIDLPVGSADDASLIWQMNNTRTHYPDWTTVHRLFEERVAASPAAIAMEAGQRQWTYSQLDWLADALSAQLQSRGVAIEAAVALLMDRSPELVMAMLATLKAGAAYVPLDPANPPERLRAITADTKAAILLTTESHADEARAFGIDVVVVDADPRHARPPSTRTSATADCADQLAYVMYTSGSTGQPKGIAITHRAIVRLVRDTDYVNLAPSDRVGHLSSAAFDAATFEIWGPLLTGGRLIVIDRDTVLSPQSLTLELERHSITVLFVTTALLNKVASERPDAFRGLRCLLFGGEAVDPRWVAEVLEAGPPTRVLHVYGPTETTTFATWHQVTAVPPGAVSIPIGGPIANTRAYVLDRYLRPVPRGGIGELYLGGDGLARGYLGQSRRTAEVFLPDPSNIEPGVRLYRTGDRVRLVPAGVLEFLGRVDDQVKLRGYRIEPGEIEHVLQSHPRVRASLVSLHGKVGGEKQLVAYVAAGENEPGPLRSELGQLLATRLPPYMRPAVLVIVPSLPMNANGKIDRHSLPPPQTMVHSGAQSQLSEDPVEQRLAEIWRDVLGLDSVGAHDDFFELGGHSLMATQLVSRIRRTFGVELELRTVFEASTIAQLAQRLPATSPEAPVSQSVIQRVGREEHRLRPAASSDPTSHDPA